jgi:cytochrome b6-f complex iron-sulfur subunit
MDDVLIVMPARSPTRKRLGRRGLLLSAFALAGGAAAVALTRFLSVDAQQFEYATGVLRVPPHNLPQLGAAPVYFPDGRFYLVNLRPGEGGSYDAVTPRMAGSVRGGMLALNDRCTNMGCHLPWRPDFLFLGRPGWFRCPCHGATYTKAGQRVFGPAPRSMDTVPFVQHDDGSLTVRFRQIAPGGPDDPQRAVRLRS